MMRLSKRGFVAAAALGALALTGCYKVQVMSNPSVVRGVERSSWQNFFIFGLVGEARVDVRELCGGGQAATVETGMSFMNGLGSAVTFGLWAPRTVVVTCAAGTAEAKSVRILADAEGHPLAVESVVNGAVVRTEVSPTPQPGVVMASLPVQENY